MIFYKIYFYFGFIIAFINCVLSIKCHLCDSCENSNTICEGSACITREAYVDGKLRVQKMCEISGKNFPAATQTPQCYETFLWQGIKGTECLCYSDWCNTSNLSSPKFLIFFPIFVFAVVQWQ